MGASPSPVKAGSPVPAQVQIVPAPAQLGGSEVPPVGRNSASPCHTRRQPPASSGTKEVQLPTSARFTFPIWPDRGPCHGYSSPATSNYHAGGLAPAEGWIALRSQGSPLENPRSILRGRRKSPQVRSECPRSRRGDMPARTPPPANASAARRLDGHEPRARRPAHPEQVSALARCPQDRPEHLRPWGSPCDRSRR